MWGAAAPLIPEWSQRLDLSSFEAGVLLASASLTIFAVSLPASWLGTRFGSRHVTLAAVGLLACRSTAITSAPRAITSSVLSLNVITQCLAIIPASKTDHRIVSAESVISLKE